MLRSVTVKLPPETFEKIQMLAWKRGETISGTIRYLIKKGMTERVYEENTDLIASVVRKQIDQALKKYAIYPSMDDVEHPFNTLFAERLVLSRNSKNSNMPS